MANWVADFLERNPDLAARPIAKRAAHGIHFDLGGRDRIAQLTIKPVHYLDNGIYKPIDTKPILMANGWYGCPHSDVIIHPDGTVKVGIYEQKAALISASAGKLDGDRIARPFTGGVQYLYITEKGFRQEIVLEKMPDLKKVAALLDTVSGILPTKYIASALSVKDADKEQIALTDATALKTYLEKAVYPVIIDPDFTAQPDGTDGMDVELNGPGDAKTRNFGIATIIPVGAYSSAYISRPLIKFNLTSAPDTFTSATLSLYCITDYSTNARAFKIYRQKRAWVEGTRNGVTDSPATGATWERYDTTNNWSTAGGFHADDCEQTEIASRDMSATETLNEMKVWNFTPTTKANLDLGNGWLIKADTEVTDRYDFVSSDGSTSSQRPLLTITYTEAAAGNPWNYYAQQ